jgi:hypothetical protein
VDLAHREIDTSRCDVRIVTSVRWPTNIKAVAELATRWPNAIWIHLAGDSPHEKFGDKYQMHSKVIAIEGQGDAFTGFVGSHNWTFAALDGPNLEATVGCPVARRTRSQSIFDRTSTLALRRQSHSIWAKSMRI